MTIFEAKKRSLSVLRGRNEGADAFLDVNCLLQAVLKKSKTQVLLENNYEMTKDEEELFFTFVEQRASGRAVSYITGHKEFYASDFIVTKDTLAPRADTEILVESALETISASVEKKIPLRVLDLCTGTGCVGISIIKNSAKALKLFLSDINDKALETARVNAQNLLPRETADDISFIQSDLFEKIDGKFDLITANPPYVSHEDTVLLLKDGRGDPEEALDGDVLGGENGLSIIKKILEIAPAYMENGGFLMIECGSDNIYEGQIYASSLYRSSEIRFDLGGKARVLILHN